MDAIRAKPVTYEALFTKKMDSLFIWSYEDFLDGLRADYSDQGSIRHMAEVDCHKAFMDAMEELFSTGKYFTLIYIKLSKIYEIMQLYLFCFYLQRMQH